MQDTKLMFSITLIMQIRERVGGKQMKLNEEKPENNCLN